MRRAALLHGLASAALPLAALSAPMGFKDSWMAMGDMSPNWREGFANYAFTPRDAVGPSLLYMRSDDKTKTRELAEVAYTRLLKRWILPHAQANVWFVGGLGAVRGSDFSGTRTMATPGIQVDYETQRVYASAFARLSRAEGINHDYASARLGFSFYETDYDEVQPWFVVEARRMRGLSDKTEITPMLRLVHNRYFVEAGVNNSKQLRANFMYTF
jgi:hypothetical protein